MSEPISISNIASISSLGVTSEEIWNSYLSGTAEFEKISMDSRHFQVSVIADSAKKQLDELKEQNPTYRKLDRSVLLGILAARNAIHSHEVTRARMGVNVGSSRGATQLFEGYYDQFLQEGRVSAFTSPTTTLGNLSSWIAQDLKADGFKMEHSVTCSTALHAMVNGIAWLRSGMADSFLTGGSEAPLTKFTLAQMDALKLYSKIEDEHPCLSMHFEKEKNTMILGEGAAIALLERGIHSHTQAVVKGVGFASEQLQHNSSISENAECFQQSMRMALEDAQLKTVDSIIMHAPGTIKGDKAEKNAIDSVFQNEKPRLTSNKWLTGHTLGASGMMSIEMGVLMLKHQQFIANPFYQNNGAESSLQSIMINAVGFGGNAVSIIISNPSVDH